MPSSLWSGSRPATCLETKCFCENPQMNSWVRQPWNAWSSLFFCLLAVVVLAKSLGESAIGLGRSLVFVFGMMLTGLGSFYFHASLTFNGQTTDVLGMYVLALFFILYNIERLIGRKGSYFYFIHIFCVLAFGSMIIYFPHTRRILFSTFVVLFLIIAPVVQYKVKSELNSHYLWGAIGSFAVATVFWYVDCKGYLCHQSFPIGHVIWHGLTATSALLLFFYYNSEDVRRIA